MAKCATLVPLKYLSENKQSPPLKAKSNNTICNQYTNITQVYMAYVGLDQF